MAEKYEGTPEELAPLSTLGDYEVADDSVDVRGWKVTGSTGTDVGTVNDLLVDPTSMKARYLVVSLDNDTNTRRTAAGVGSDQPVLVPVARARIDDRNNRVHLDSSGAGLAQLPRYSGAAVERDYNDTFGRHEKIGRHEGDAQRLTRSAEELSIGKRAVQAGEVRVHKHVETERVSQPVSRTREEVHVERRPVADGEYPRAEIRDDEVRVPIMEEEVVVEKRPVVKEELVIGKERVKETDNVETDLRKERVDVERTGERDRHGRGPKPRGEV